MVGPFNSLSNIKTFSWPKLIKPRSDPPKTETKKTNNSEAQAPTDVTSKVNAITTIKWHTK